MLRCSQPCIILHSWHKLSFHTRQLSVVLPSYFFCYKKYLSRREELTLIRFSDDSVLEGIFQSRRFLTHFYIYLTWFVLFCCNFLHVRSYPFPCFYVVSWGSEIIFVIRLLYTENDASYSVAVSGHCFRAFYLPNNQWINTSIRLMWRISISINTNDTNTEIN